MFNFPLQVEHFRTVDSRFSFLNRESTAWTCGLSNSAHERRSKKTAASPFPLNSTLAEVEETARTAAEEQWTARGVAPEENSAHGNT